MYCTTCGTKNPDGSDHCFNCGDSMDAPGRPEAAVASRSGAASEKASTANALARVDIVGRVLSVTEREVSFGNQVLKCDEVVAIRYGIYKHYINGIRDSQSYAIWLTDGRSVMSIECANGLFARTATIEARYQQAIKALYPAVMVPLIQSFLANLDKGTWFQVGGITFDKTGLHRSGSFGAIQKGILGAWTSIAGGRSVEEREQRYQLLPWVDFGGHSFGPGHVHLFRQKEEWVRFSLRDTWNAVCLGPLFDFLYEDGRLWQFVKRKPELGHILVVDDDEPVREVICSMLNSEGYNCHGFAGGTEALAWLQSGETVELILSDLMNSPMDGLTLLEHAKTYFPDIPFIVVTAVRDDSVTAHCMKSGAYDYLLHPVTRQQLVSTVRRALDERKRKVHPQSAIHHQT